MVGPARSIYLISLLLKSLLGKSNGGLESGGPRSFLGSLTPYIHIAWSTSRASDLCWQTDL